MLPVDSSHQLAQTLSGISTHQFIADREVEHAPHDREPGEYGRRGEIRIQLDLDVLEQVRLADLSEILCAKERNEVILDEAEARYLVARLKRGPI